MTTERALSGGSRSQVSAGAQCYHPRASCAVTTDPNPSWTARSHLAGTRRSPIQRNSDVSPFNASWTILRTTISPASSSTASRMSVRWLRLPRGRPLTLPLWPGSNGRPRGRLFAVSRLLFSADPSSLTPSSLHRPRGPPPYRRCEGTDDQPIDPHSDADALRNVQRAEDMADRPAWFRALRPRLRIRLATWRRAD